MSIDATVAERLVSALAAGDRAAVLGTLADQVRLRALLPGRWVDLTGREAVATEMLGWFAEVAEVVPEATEVVEVGGLLRLGYRFGLRGGSGGDRVVEQQAYVTLAGAQVTAIRLACSGFRPAGGAPEAGRELDALGQGCATLTPLIGAALRGMVTGQVLAVLTDDPAAPEGIASWSRLTGHEVVATVPTPDGTRYYLRHA